MKLNAHFKTKRLKIEFVRSFQLLFDGYKNLKLSPSFLITHSSGDEVHAKTGMGQMSVGHRQGVGCDGAYSVDNLFIIFLIKNF